MKITNCPNCGAPLHGMKCEYCGTELKGNFMKLDSGDANSPYGVIDIGGNEFKVYFAGIRMEAENVMPNYIGRRDSMILKRKFTVTMIEA